MTLPATALRADTIPGCLGMKPYREMGLARRRHPNGACPGHARLGECAPTASLYGRADDRVGRTSRSNDLLSRIEQGWEAPHRIPGASGGGPPRHSVGA